MATSITEKFDIVRSLSQEMKRNDLILAYVGEFTQDIAKTVLQMAEKNLDMQGEDLVVKRKVFNVMIECLQNIVKHKESTYDPARSSIFIVGVDDSSYIISSGNIIPNEAVSVLENRLQEINSLDKEGLKELHKQIVTRGSLSENGNAGLGLVDIARKSGSRLEYKMVPEGVESTFYTLLIRVPKIKLM